MRDLTPLRCINIISIVIVGMVVILFGSTMISCRKETGLISKAEKTKIETWIIENDLNRYGDSKDTVYMGGTPLFNERTGERTDRYEYILRRHPDKPWLQLQKR